MTHILLFGDSITWGACDNEKGGWAERLKLFYFNSGSAIYNCGISGDTTEELKERIIGEFKSRGLRHEREVKVVIAMGINDARDIDENNTPQLKDSDFKKNLMEIFDSLSEQQHFDINKDLVFVGPTIVDEKLTLPWNNKELYWKNDRIQVFNDIIENFCKEKNLPFLNLLNLLDKGDLEDGLHPNAEGHEKMFLEIKKFLIENGFISD